jgi:hypothetical protein
MYFTIYKISNKIDGKFYIGSHKTKNLDDNYMGSGKYLKYAQQKYGIKNFEKEILFVYDNKEDMYSKEAEIVTEEFLATENTYNLKIGGFGGWDYINSNDTLRRSKNKLARKTADKTILKKYGVCYPYQIDSVKIKLRDNTKKRWKNGEMTLSPNFSFKGKFHTDESKLQMKQRAIGKQVGCKNSQFGSIWITNGIDNKKIKNTDPIPENWIKGRKMKK